MKPYGGGKGKLFLRLMTDDVMCEFLCVWTVLFSFCSSFSYHYFFTQRWKVLIKTKVIFFTAPALICFPFLSLPVSLHVEGELRGLAWLASMSYRGIPVPAFPAFPVRIACWSSAYSGPAWMHGGDEAGNLPQIEHYVLFCFFALCLHQSPCFKSKFDWMVVK